MKKCITEGCQTTIFDATFGDKCIVCLEKEQSLDRVYESAPPPIEPIITEPAAWIVEQGKSERKEKEEAIRLFQKILEVHGSDMKGELIIKIVRMQAKLRGK